ncbi:MAG: efflux RND transporter periplasmic adaptor subunit [Paludibacteraceae bacterium]|nr:efflux RND transporter periplasmic adaptor subunit [Paludibacteraceae bacterium]
MNKIVTILASMALVVSMASCSEEQTTVQEVEKVEKVQVMKLAATEIEREVILPTTLEGYDNMKISSSVSGIIDDILVDVGDKVSKNQLLVKMDPTQYTTTKLSYANLGVEMGRMEALKAAGSISQQIYDQTKTQYEQLKEQLALFEKNTFVRADFAGVISARNFEPGELCAGQPILQLTQINKLKAYINVQENYFPYLKNGMKLTIVSDIYPGKQFPATVEMVYPTIDPSSHTFTVKVTIPNASETLRPGMYVSTSIPVGKVKGMLVPYQSVLKLIGSNERYVFVNDGGKAKRVTVTLGKRFDRDVEIISEELKEGDELIVVGQGRLVDGVKLEIVK